MNNKRLLMVTTAFPYGQGESFVDAELRYMAESFEEVTLVPCFFTADKPPRAVAHGVELAYARARWGASRILHVAVSLTRALWGYRWLGEAVFVLKSPHRRENLKELIRCLYRARLFEQFLERQRAAGRHYDMIYFYWIVPEIAGALAFRQKARSFSVAPLTIVARAHGGDLYEERRSGGYAGLTDAIMAGVDAVFCISAHGRAYLAHKYPGLTERFHLARLGVEDPGFISPQRADDTLSILSCSFMVPGKRIHLIADAIAMLLSENADLTVRWTHIGDGELFQQLESYVARVLDNQRVEVVFKGYMRQPDLVAFYRETPFDVIVNVSDTEGIPVSLMEASAVGIPMVATDVGGSGEIVNSTNGVLIDENADCATIAAALLKFHDKGVAAGYRARARAYWHAHFNAETNYVNFGKALHQSMEQS
jgi:colanic acid/amylovoran biosynthesis glycosyltransferase